MSNFMKIQPVGALRTDLRTDGRIEMTKLIVALSNFFERAQKCLKVRRTAMITSKMHQKGVKEKQAVASQQHKIARPTSNSPKTLIFRRRNFLLNFSTSCI